MPLATRHASNIDTTYDELTIWRKFQTLCLHIVYLHIGIVRGTSCIPALANGVQPAPRTPPHKRQKLSPSRISPRLAAATEGSASQLPAPPPSTTEVDALPPQTPNSRKRARSPTSPLATSKPLDTLPPPATPLGPAITGPSGSTPARQEAGKKKPRTNTPWSAEEEQLLKRLRDEHKGWAEIAKVDERHNYRKGQHN